MGAASRDLLIEKAGTTLLGINTKSITVGSSSIDITTDEDNGYRTLLDANGLDTLDISGSGVTKDTLLRGVMMTSGSKMLTDITIQYPPVGGQAAGDTISGDFYLTSLGESGGGSDQAITFDISLQSSGAWTYTVGV